MKGVGIVLLVLVSIIFVSIGNVEVNSEKISNNPKKYFNQQYTYKTHNPILIISNSEFTSGNGVIGGNGTNIDPYIIDGWKINSGNASRIDIRNSTAFLIIRNCFLDAGLVNGREGIDFTNVSNGKIEDNIISNNQDGIILAKCRNILVLSNSISNNYAGMAIGVSFSYLNNITISSNEISFNQNWGIEMSSSKGDVIINNNIYSNGDSGIYVFSAVNTINISYNNIYLNKQSGISIGSSGVSNFYNIYIQYNNISNNVHFGVELAVGCGNNFINHNNFVNNNKNNKGIMQCFDMLNNVDYWNTTTEGNYWSDYTSKYPSAKNNGVIWDTPYQLNDTSNPYAKDFKPLVNPVSNSGSTITEFVSPSNIIVPLTLVIIAIIIYQKRSKIR